VREVREEAAVDVVVERLVGVYWRPRKSATILQFLCRIAAGTPMPSEEAAEAAFFPLGLLPYRIAPVVRERIQDSFEDRIVWRTQEGLGASEFVATLPASRDF
jgi:ADP-ribose pyrophosphatase YjhB (NUDIX family)